MGITTGQIISARSAREHKHDGRRTRERERLRSSGFYRPAMADGTHVDRPHTMLLGPVDMPPLMTEPEL